MKIVIASDHGGYTLKKELVAHLECRGFEINDIGAYSETSVDYPDYAEAASKLVLSGEAQFGILICGTGIGISISANKIDGIRCALCTDPYMADMARRHNDANMLAFGGRVLGAGLACSIADAFLGADFETGGRHSQRVKKIMELEKINTGGNNG